MKAPAFQFYVKDWLSDPQLKMASHSTKGIWMDMLCFMWDAPNRGELVGTVDQLSRMVGATVSDFERFMSEAESLSFCYFCVTPTLLVTVRNRRMFREEKDKEFNRLRQERFRHKQKSNANITPPSPVPSPTPTTKDKNIKPIADTPKTGVSSDHREFIKYAVDSFEQTFHERMFFDGGKDGSIVKKLLGTYGLERLKGLWDVFIQSDDDFIGHAGRSIGVFKSQINKILSGGNGNGTNRSGSGTSQGTISQPGKYAGIGTVVKV
jgi:hypothetical protein